MQQSSLDKVKNNVERPQWKPGEFVCAIEKPFVTGLLSGATELSINNATIFDFTQMKLKDGV